MFVTKHCKPADRERMLRGHFKIGSHAEYSQGEKTGLLSDNEEGRGRTDVFGDMDNWSGNIGGMSFRNLTVINSRGPSTTIEEKINCPMFCASRGAYLSHRHRRILDGDETENYQPNSEVTAHLVLDVALLRKALTLSTDELFKKNTKWIFRNVHYADRISKLEAKTFRYSSEDRLLKIAFMKPSGFSLEEESRFIMLPRHATKIPKSIFTSEQSTQVQEAFRSAIVHAGAANYG